ncbi:glycosyltransferase family 2 protein [Piedraia hortae CBS 480.64]|uniref:Glycosyltransferase family 2 protein n=1 Tax=Piedraia hortae CBS 480.64 TaxID=1314780 RepID=A0A6A7C3V2_9PEZI|nr:glycosyltransferase family 2 protein [Piedraia hortae CBS 480.64]
MIPWLALASFIWLFRYLRLIINCLSHWTYRSTPPLEKSSYNAHDVTIIMPTISFDLEQIQRTIRSCLAAAQCEIILVGVDANVAFLTGIAQAIGPKVRVLCTHEANKRGQICHAIPQVQTPITIFVDDDVIWPNTIMPWLLAPFHDEQVGGVGTSQRLVRSTRQSVWFFLGAAYLERRNFDCSACLHIDGGLPCLSGRTVAYRSEILQDPAFTYHFTHEEWRTCQLNTDDDNFLTRWLFNHDWKIAMQYHAEAEVQTTLAEGPLYLTQCLRWVRSNWRSNLTSLIVERRCWRTHPWTTYAVLQTTLTAWALPYDLLIAWAWYRAMGAMSLYDAKIVLLVLWFAFSKTVKLWGHFYRYPSDIIFVPVYILFGYFHGVIKFYGLLTLSETKWGSRAEADTDDNVRMIRLPSYQEQDDSHNHRDFAMLEDEETKVSSEELPPYPTMSL